MQGIPGQLPSMSTTEKARMGRGGIGGDREMPADLQEIDHIVCIAPPQEKRVLIVYYTQRGYPEEKAARLDMTLREFKDVRERAESFVAMNL